MARYNLFSAAALMIGFAPGFGAHAGGLPLPEGWRAAELAEFAGTSTWHERTVRGGDGLSGSGDMDGDGHVDSMRLLARQDGGGYALFASFPRADGRVEHIRYLPSEGVLPLERIAAWGISSLPPGKARSFCGKGYEPCAPGEPEFLELPHGGIEVHVLGKASRIVFWRDGAFAEETISD